MPLQKIPKRELKIFNIDELTIEQNLDKKESGAYGEIHYGIINSTNTPIALKKFKEDFSMQILDKDVTKEIIILQLLNQFPETNTVQLFGLYFNENGKNCYLVLEKLETTLHNITVRVKRDNLKILVEQSTLTEDESFIDLSKGKNSLGDIEAQLSKLLKD